MNNILITVITSTFNCGDDLKITADSIRKQTCKNIQWIVADGLSVDSTLDIINDNLDIISNWFSESDTGIYNAWNKACQLIEGEWVVFLGAGDYFHSNDTVQIICEKLSKLTPEVFIAYGDVLQLDNNILKIRHGKVNLHDWQICRPALPCHQGVFQRSSTLRSVKPFDESYKIVSDTKLVFNTLKNGDIYYLDVIVSVMDMWGVSAHPKYSIRVMKEFLSLEKELGYKMPFLKKIKYILVVYSRYFIFKLLNERVVEWMSSLFRKKITL